MKRLIFDNYAHRVKEGLPVKRSLWLCRNISDVADLYDELCELLPEHHADPKTYPFVMNHSSVGPIISQQKLSEREGQV